MTQSVPETTQGRDKSTQQTNLFGGSQPNSLAGFGIEIIVLIFVSTKIPEPFRLQFFLQ